MVTQQGPNGTCGPPTLLNSKILAEIPHPGRTLHELSGFRTSLMEAVPTLLLAAVVDDRLRLARVRVKTPVEAVSERGTALADKEVVALGAGEDGCAGDQEEPRKAHAGLCLCVCLLGEEGYLLVTHT